MDGDKLETKHEHQIHIPKSPESESANSQFPKPSRIYEAQVSPSIRRNGNDVRPRVIFQPDRRVFTQPCPLFNETREFVVEKTKTEQHIVCTNDIDYEIPSPPLSSSASPSSIPRRPCKRAKFSSLLQDHSKPPSNSTNNTHYYKHHAITKHEALPSSSPPSTPNQTIDTNAPYYIRSFKYILQQVLQRYTRILHASDINITERLNALNENSLSLFVRLYNRKQPNWFKVETLHEKYAQVENIENAINETGQHLLIVDSNNIPKKDTVQIAINLLHTLQKHDLNQVCLSVSDGHKLKNKSRSIIIDHLHCILENKKQVKGKGKKQMTLSGVSPRLCLAKCILKIAGHRIRIPDNVIISIRRIYFLFFLNVNNFADVLLTDCNIWKFPEYNCQPKEIVFLSRNGYEHYEKAVQLKNEIDDAIDTKNYENVTFFASIAELELREYFNNNKSNYSIKKCDEYGWISNKVDDERIDIRAEMDVQLKHPFFKRFTPVWIYTTMCYHSIEILQKIGEYESACDRLKLILGSGCLSNRRKGACSDRLSIILSKLKRSEEAVELIENALKSEAPLNSGDRLSLASRGANIFRRLHGPIIEQKIKQDEDKNNKNKKLTKAKLKEMVKEKVENEMPQGICKVINENGRNANIKVRNIVGKSLNVQYNEKRKGYERKAENIWESFNNEESKDSFALVEEDGNDRKKSMKGKSVFESKKNGEEISVETYCIEHYEEDDGWTGVWDEGTAIKFIFSLCMWESTLFGSDVADVFQTPYQDRPLDLHTDAFYESRKHVIDTRVAEISAMSGEQIMAEIAMLYHKYKDVRAVGCAWSRYESDVLSGIAYGVGGKAVARVCQLMCQDFTYWASGLPDLTLWRRKHEGQWECKLVEVKSPRDRLSDKQTCWLSELLSTGADCEVCKVVETKSHVHINTKACHQTLQPLRLLTSLTQSQNHHHHHHQ